MNRFVLPLIYLFCVTLVFAYSRNVGSRRQWKMGWLESSGNCAYTHVDYLWNIFWLGFVFPKLLSSVQSSLLNSTSTIIHLTNIYLVSATCQAVCVHNGLHNTSPWMFSRHCKLWTTHANLVFPPMLLSQWLVPWATLRLGSNIWAFSSPVLSPFIQPTLKSWKIDLFTISQIFHFSPSTLIQASFIPH